MPPVPDLTQQLISRYQKRACKHGGGPFFLAIRKAAGVDEAVGQFVRERQPSAFEWKPDIHDDDWQVTPIIGPLTMQVSPETVLGSKVSAIGTSLFTFMSKLTHNASCTVE